MSYNSNGTVYTPPTGAETAASGNVLQSAVWNAINTDYATAFSKVGLVGFNGSIIKLASRGISLSVANTDNQVTVPVSVFPLSGANYQVNQVILSNASASCSGATFALYTASGAGGTAIVTASTACTITNTSPNTTNAMQLVTPNAQTTANYSNGTLFFRTGAGTASATVDVFIEIRPL